jgi:hypothetical protein
VDKNTTVVFPAPLMSTIEELGSFLTREKAASAQAAAARVAVTVAPKAVSPDSVVTLAAANGGTSPDAS